jgi:hypothetical protein
VLILTRFDAVPAEYRRTGRAADRHLISCRPARIESRRWTVFPAGLTRSSLVVKAAVALSPIVPSSFADQEFGNRYARKMPGSKRRGHHRMGKVSIWAQWLIIVAVLSLSPLLVLFMAGVFGRSLFRKLWRAVGASALAEM